MFLEKVSTSKCRLLKWKGIINQSQKESIKRFFAKKKPFKNNSRFELATFLGQLSRKWKYHVKLKTRDCRASDGMKTRPESDGRKQSIVKRETGQRVNERAIEEEDRKRNRKRDIERN